MAAWSRRLLRRLIWAERTAEIASAAAEAAVDLGEDVVERLQGARHFEIGELRADLVADGLHRAPAAIAA
jgi:hypothetical protein